MLYDLLLLILIIPILGQITSYLKDNIPKYINKIYSRISKQSIIEFIGYDKLDYGEFIPTYPEAMLSVFRWTIHQKKVKTLRYYNKQRGLWEKCKDEGLTDLNYMIVEGKNIELEEGLYMDVDHQKLEDPNLEKKVALKTSKLILNLRSVIHNTEYINRFVNKCIKFNREYELGLNKNKLYHFTFKGYDSNHNSNFNECFHISVLKEFDNDDEKSYINKSKPFSNLFFDNKEKLIKRLDKLKDYEYYERTGSRRKVGLLFYGPAGCGKTRCVNEIAIEYKRHIIEVPMSRIKKNSDIEELFNLTKIGCTEIDKEEVIFLFDEIDQLGKILYDRNIDSGKKESNKYKESEEKNKFENSEDSKENALTKVIKDYMSLDSCKPNTDDSINLGTLLSRLDGIGNYDGLITIATTNCIEKLDSALKRPGRLDPYLFDYANKYNIIDIIENDLQVKLSEEQIQRLPDRDSSLCHALIIKLTQDYEEDLEGLITVLESYKKS